MTSFAVVGAGWRAAAFWRLAALFDDLDCVGVVARTPRDLPVPVYGTLGACVAATRPDFVVTSVPHSVNPRIVTEAVERGLPVLSETPPAGDRAGLDGLRHLGDRVQVAEQYLLMPSHAARLAAIRAGAIGTPTQAQVSSTQLYHAVSLIRGMLGAAPAPVTVRATRHTAMLADPLERGGWTDDASPRPATTTIAMLDLGGGRSGLYDFTDRQTRNQLRFRRLVVRGSHGELRDDEVVRLTGPRTLVRTPIVRSPDNAHLSLGGEILYRHPYPGMRLNDDETATAALLHATAAWSRGDGPPPYPLDEAVHDTRVGLAIEEAAATGRTVATG